jgi:uncharacterized membrane protein HdeD (DUF308 family)
MNDKATYGGRVRHWWLSILVGLLAIVVGILCMTTPDATLTSLTLLFILVMLFDGVADIVTSVVNRRILPASGWLALCGAAELVLGLFLLSQPPMQVTYVVCFWIALRAVWSLLDAYLYWRYDSEGGQFSLAILALGFAVAAAISPYWSETMLVSLLSMAFFAYGIYRITHAFELRVVEE